MTLPLLVQDAVRSTAEGRFDLFGGALADPWFLRLIPGAVGLLWRGREAKRHASARVPTVAEGAVLPSPHARLVWLPAVLRIACAVLALVGLSRPLEGRVALGRESEGIDIALLLDRSTSMEQRSRPSAPRRFDVVREVVAEFAERRMTDEAGARDNIALIGFARFADLLVPFTLDVDSVLGSLAELDVEGIRQLDGTGIGSALAEAVDVMEKSSSKSRVVVLLTDGEETGHEIAPLTAAQLAAERGVRVYTVYAGPRESVVRVFRELRTIPANVGDLPEIAKMTGGRFFHASSQDELEAAYEAIEELERTPRVEERFAERYDLYPRVLLPALLLYLLSWLAGASFARRLP